MKNGLKGVTDAMVFCKSMKSGGEKNQMMRSMKSYAEGGAASSSQGPIFPKLKKKIKRGMEKIKNNLNNCGSGSTFRKNCAGGNWD